MLSEMVQRMAKDDYHVIVYQILSYLYVQLKAGKPVDPGMISADSLNYKINQQYWQYIMINLLKDGYILGITAEEIRYIGGSKIEIAELEHCQITPKGIDYLVDNSFMKKARQLLNDAASIAPWAGLVIK